MKKSFLKSFLFSFLSFLLLSASCEKDDTPSESFSPTTISLEGIDITTSDESFTANGFTFKSENAETVSPTFDLQGIALYNGARIELDLSGVSGIKKISVKIFNNSDPEIKVLSNENVVKEVTTDIPGGITTVEVNVKGLTIDALSILSYEATINSIKLE